MYTDVIVTCNNVSVIVNEKSSLKLINANSISYNCFIIQIYSDKSTSGISHTKTGVRLQFFPIFNWSDSFVPSLDIITSN